MAERDPFIDYLKGVAILLVIIGHAIQYSDALTSDFFSNPGFKFIYLFHMPLFALLSGYVSTGIASKPFRPLLTSRIRRLIIPEYLWLGIGLAVEAGFYALFTSERILFDA